MKFDVSKMNKPQLEQFIVEAERNIATAKLALEARADVMKCLLGDWKPDVDS
jgi:hypothetical protein